MENFSGTWNAVTAVYGKLIAWGGMVIDNMKMCNGN